MRLNREEISALIPHAGSMVLLDEVIESDAGRIVCRSAAHQDRGNPLYVGGQLASVCGIEFAAQAMAIHGGLAARADRATSVDGIDAKPRAGFLASVRQVEMHVDRLDDVRGVLTVEAVREAGDESNVLYRFEVRAGNEPLVSGRAAVVLQMSDPTDAPPA